MNSPPSLESLRNNFLLKASNMFQGLKKQLAELLNVSGLEREELHESVSERRHVLRQQITQANSQKMDNAQILYQLRNELGSLEVEYALLLSRSEQELFEAYKDRYITEYIQNIIDNLCVQYPGLVGFSLIDDPTVQSIRQEASHLVLQKSIIREISGNDFSGFQLPDGFLLEWGNRKHRHSEQLGVLIRSIEALEQQIVTLHEAQELLDHSNGRAYAQLTLLRGQSVTPKQPLIDAYGTTALATQERGVFEEQVQDVLPRSSLLFHKHKYTLGIISALLFLSWTTRSMLHTPDLKKSIGIGLVEEKKINYALEEAAVQELIDSYGYNQHLDGRCTKEVRIYMQKLAADSIVLLPESMCEGALRGENARVLGYKFIVHAKHTDIVERTNVGAFAFDFSKLNHELHLVSGTVTQRAKNIQTVVDSLTNAPAGMFVLTLTHPRSRNGRGKFYRTSQAAGHTVIVLKTNDHGLVVHDDSARAVGDLNEDLFSLGIYLENFTQGGYRVQAAAAFQFTSRIPPESIDEETPEVFPEDE